MSKPSALTPDAQHDRTQKAFWVEEVRMLERSLTNAEASLRAAAHNHASGIKPRQIYEAARHYAQRCDELTDARVALSRFRVRIGGSSTPKRP